jgi:flagellar biosynthesis/type III secretory pathway M-ring protein FliF/YscJ
MNFDFKALLDALAKAPARTKLVVVLSLAAVAVAIGLGGWIAGQPHFVKLYSSLSDHERVAVEKALATSEIRYRVSDFPGPFVIYVDEAQYDQAQIAVALAEALKTSPEGIESDLSGPASIFMSAGERNQTILKREWQEAERLLERLDFVADATVTTSTPDSSPLRSRAPVMVSVALQLENASTLSQEQAGNVARLVRYKFGAPAENVVITDQSGRTLYDPSIADDPSQRARDILSHSDDYDREMAEKANQHITAAFGQAKALVTVTSQWNYDQSTIVDEKVDPKAVAVQVDTKETTTPQGGSSAGGPAGVSSAAPQDFGNESAQVPNGTTAAATPVTKTKDEKKVFETSRSKTQTVRNVPRLERLFVSLVIDESLAAKKDEIQKIVEAAVGFDSTRQDVIGVSTTTLAAPQAADPNDPAASGEPESDGGLGPTTELLLQRGVEIASALAFLVLLVTSLRGSKKAKSAASEARSPARAGTSGAAHHAASDGAAPAPEVEIDPDQLARAQIEELVRTDPRRVGEILSRWADDRTTVRTG